MDQLPAQATFVEITFAVNLLFAAYRDFRDYLKEHLAKKVEEFEATIKTLEISFDRLDILETIVRQYARAFENAQQICVCVATVVSLVAAACCVAVVFCDWLTILGHHTGWLFLPLPVYFLASGCNYAVFRIRGNRMLRRFRNYSSEFDPPRLPVVAQVSILRRLYLACLWAQFVFWILCGLALASLYVSGFFVSTLNQQWLLLLATRVVFPVSDLLSIVIVGVFIRERFFVKENDQADRPSFLSALPSAIFLATMIFVIWR